ncbi:peptide arginase, FlmR/OhkR family [Maribacter flavus]|uniref:Uncharacterized protein n=1 Tax=Maribacter flavus TaxID=1658664 RepID=A0A5B2TNJ8_9FLAO|nr:UPF0489 family protein [Maribacter flavus]KAA2215789.1 hypothetical protein F0361_16470 [Maribacter flavus]
MDNAIKTIIVEEHNEAFFVWHYAIKEGYIKKEGNCLFHIDEHSDMNVPFFNTSINDLNGDLQKVDDFTDEEVAIAGFITPAVYMGIFDNVYWIKRKHRKRSAKNFDLFIGSHNDEGRKLMLGEIQDNGKLDMTSKRFNYLKLEPHEIQGDCQNVILDIDLDFFSCSGNPNFNEKLFVEISKSEYDNFNSDRYHRLRYVNIGKIGTLKREGKYYYVFNDYEGVQTENQRLTESEIKEEIERFVGYLDINNIRPSLIDICRSRFSGYTPKDQWEFIEKHLIDALSKIYPLEIEMKGSLVY